MSDIDPVAGKRVKKTKRIASATRLEGRPTFKEVTMIRITKTERSNGHKHVAEFPDSLLANVCLQVAGGGWTQGQTIKAMTMQDALKRDGRVKVKNVLIEIVAEAAEPDLGQMFDMAYEDQCRDACGL